MLVLGDSLSAAYGMPVEQGWVALLEQRLQDLRPGIRLENASISGETTSGGLARLPALLERHQPDLVILELGANDGLRGTPLSVLERNLEALVTRSQAAGAQVLLLGMRLPPNYGQRYADAFARTFVTVAERYQLAAHPFFLDGVGGNPALTQADGLHPNREAQPRLLENVWPLISRWLNGQH